MKLAPTDAYINLRTLGNPALIVTVSFDGFVFFRGHSLLDFHGLVIDEVWRFVETFVVGIVPIFFLRAHDCARYFIIGCKSSLTKNRWPRHWEDLPGPAKQVQGVKAAWPVGELGKASLTHRKGSAMSSGCH
jgi:hypothetical protein